MTLMQQVFILAIALIAHASTVLAQDGYEGDTKQDFSSPERFAVELRAGTYQPDVGNDSFDNVFDDSGPMLALEFDVFAFRIPYVGLIGLGTSIGWADYSDSASTSSGASTGEETSLSLIPLSGMAVLRIDVLARELGVPFLFTGKIGGDFVFWSTGTGDRDDASDVSVGLRWAAQVALELDFLDRRSARSLDEEWGINHTFVFFELYGSTAGEHSDSAMPVGDVTWAAGLGLIF